MTKRKTLPGLRFFLLLALAAVGSCTGGPAAPPAPLAEIPAFMTFPQDLSIDVSTVATPVNSASSAVKAQAVGSGPFTSIIVAGADLARTTFNLFVRLALRPLERLAIPVSPQIAQFEAEITEGSAPGTFKVDFSDFDFDGDGNTEGCTGCTCPLGCSTGICPRSSTKIPVQPVCYRVWFRPQGQSAFGPFMAGVFNQLPVKDNPATSEDEENPGVGRFRRAAFEVGPGEPAQLGAVYDHRDPADARNKRTQVALRTEFLFEGGTTVSFSNIDVDQTGLDNPSDPNNLLKTIRATTQSIDSKGDEDVLQYRGRFREDADFFSGTVVNPGGEVPLFCAQISTGDAAQDAASCDNLGISVADLDFLPFATLSDVELPADFPATPPF